MTLLVALNLKVPPPMLDRLRLLAEGNDRTVSAEVRRAIEAHLDNAETKGTP